MSYMAQLVVAAVSLFVMSAVASVSMHSDVKGWDLVMIICSAFACAMAAASVLMKP